MGTSKVWDFLSKSSWLVALVFMRLFAAGAWGWGVAVGSWARVVLLAGVAKAVLLVGVARAVLLASGCFLWDLRCFLWCLCFFCVC